MNNLNNNANPEKDFVALSNLKVGVNGISAVGCLRWVFISVLSLACGFVCEISCQKSLGNFIKSALFAPSAFQPTNFNPPQHQIMASNRSFGQEISANRRRSGEVLFEMRAVILNKLQDGQKPGKITDALNISGNTVYYTKKR